MAPDIQASGKKRKRVSSQTDLDIATKLKNKLHHGIIEVRRVAKKIRGLEVQKSVKRLKGARSKNSQSSEVAHFEAELTYLKALDIEQFGSTALHSKLKKDKVLSSNEHFVSALASEPFGLLISSAKPGSPESKVDARLLSSKLLASEVSSVVTSIRNVINPPPKDQNDVEDEGEDEDEEEEDVREPKSVRMKATKVVSVFSAAAQLGEDTDEQDEDGAPEREVLEEEDEVDDGGWESGSIDSEGGQDSEDEESQGGDGQESDSGDDEVPPAKKTKTSTAHPLAKTTTQTATQTPGAAASTFLPSLSVGFARGDSDSEPEDIDSGPKKNRRGQRARRAIWEKKYGKNANHVKKDQESGKGRHQRPGAPPKDKRLQHGTGPANAYPNNHLHEPARPQTSKGNVAGNHREEVRQDKPLHPSWEAKRKLKEKQSASMVPAQGKKIVF